MTRTMLLASTQSARPSPRRWMAEAKVLASFVSFTDGRAWSPMPWVMRAEPSAACSAFIFARLSWRQLLRGRSHLFQRAAAGGLGRRHNRPLYDRRVADHNSAAPGFG